MAGDRQGLAPAARAQGPIRKANGWRAEAKRRTVTTEVSCFARNAWNTQGKKLRSSPLQQGIKRRSHLLPTKAIHEAAYEGGFVSVRPKVIGKVRMFRSTGWLTIAGMKSRCAYIGASHPVPSAAANGYIASAMVRQARSCGNRCPLPNQHIDRDALASGYDTAA
jgi:hypothetical protein